jgi:hypothetical protein
MASIEKKNEPPRAAEPDASDESSQEDSSSGAVVVGSSTEFSSVATQTAFKSSPAVVLKRFLEKLDQFLLDFVNFTSSAVNQERSLKVLQWTLWLFAYLKKSPGLRKLYLDVSFSRYILRVLGFPAALEAARSGSWGAAASSTSKQRNWWISKLGSIMAYSMMLYYPSDHLAYLGWMAPSVLPRMSSPRMNKLLHNANLVSAYSCRCWLVFLIAEMAQTTVKLKDLMEQKQSLTKNEGGADHDEALASLQHTIRNHQLQLIRSLLFTLPCIHWSLPRWDKDPWLRESVVNGLMWVESIVSLYQSIVNYRVNGK